MKKLVEVKPGQIKEMVRQLGGTKDLAGDVEYCYALVRGGVELKEAIATVKAEEEDNWL